MARSSIIRTFGQIHFEDLARELAYDLRDWQS